MLDTHVVVWLYQGDLKKIPASAQALIENNDVAISPMVLLELEYLYEIKRIKVDAQTIINELTNTIDLQQPSIDFGKITAEALKLKWTRDSFDRLICATAQLMKCTLLSRDKKILEHFKMATWDTINE